MADGTEPMPQEDDLENWVLLMDLGWEPEKEDQQPPIEAVVGMWPIEDGKAGKFRANPGYVPADENSPTDPLDAALRLVLRGQGEIEQVQLILRDSLFDIAMNGDGRPLVMRSPDEIPCVVIATGEPHRQRVSSPDWRRIDLAGLVELLAEGVDVLFNPGGPAMVRLNADFMRLSLDMDEEVIERLYTEQAQPEASLPSSTSKSIHRDSSPRGTIA
ncbi:type VII secretion system-associated protein [Amycolatopsis speibonae]|uniref:Type VII secretion system-associated protein n=1 Tax=Amycolatopsis speibonae TaxID=1450224 RepID=A0ABV7PEB6_9PSEU